MRVLVTSVPGVGHLHPMLPLAKALLSQGDDVLWATGPSGCERLAAEGVQTRPVGLDETEGIAAFQARYPEVSHLAPQDRPEFMFPRLFGAVRAPAMLSGLSEVARAWSPDVVVNDAAELAGPIVAASLGIPNATHAFGALLPPTRVEAAAEFVAPLWVEHGLEPRPFAGCYDHLYLDIYPPSLQPTDASHVGAMQLLRPEGLATGDHDLPELVMQRPDLPLLYLTLGTVFTSDSLLSSILDALEDVPARVVVTVGPRGDPDALGARPSHVHVTRYVAQQHLLPHCSAVVSHGGSGTFLAAAAAGLPQLCLPQAADQFLNAAAGEKAGAALALRPPEVSPDSIRGAVDRLFTATGLRAGAEAVQREIRSMPDASEAAARLRSLAP